MKPLTAHFPMLRARTAALLTVNLLAFTLLLSSCRESTAEVIVTPSPGAAPSSESSVNMNPSAEMNPSETANAGATASPSDPAATNTDSAQNQPAWRLTRWVQNNQSVSLVSGADISLDWQEGQIGGFGGCNRFGAAYRVEGNRVIVDPLQSTMRACDGPLMDQETRLFAALQQVNRITVNGNEQITLAYGEGSSAGTLTFSPR